MLYRITLKQYAVIRTVPLIAFIAFNYVAARIFLFRGLVNFLFIVYPILSHFVVFGIPAGILPMNATTKTVEESSFLNLIQLNDLGQKKT